VQHWRFRAADERPVRAAGVLLFVILSAEASAQTEAAPTAAFSTRDWTRHYLRRAFTSPARWATLNVTAAYNQALRNPEEWRGGAGGYARRYASAAGNRVVENTAEYAAGLALRQDTRYRASESRRFRARIWSALWQSVATPQPGGGAHLALPRYVGLSVAPIVASTWDPRPLTGKRLARSLGEGLASQAGLNLMDEFTPELKKLARKIFGRRQ
jgi:hypothetical protein